MNKHPEQMEEEADLFAIENLITKDEPKMVEVEERYYGGVLVSVKIDGKEQLQLPFKKVVHKNERFIP